jgi:flavin reductase (DIM6/NTAB) family NADH-FMN oxidoreductase RutF
MKLLPLSRVYRLLEPGPVVMLTTAQRRRQNVMAMSWHTMMDFEPPIVGCVVSNRDYSFNTLKATKECVIAIPTVELATTVVKVGNTSGRDIDKFRKFKISTQPASQVKAPLLEACYANLECKVIDTTMTGTYNFFVLEVLKAWINPANKHPQTIHHLGRGFFMVAGKTIKLPSRMK